MILKALLLAAVLQGATAGMLPPTLDFAVVPPPTQFTAEELVLNQLCAEKCTVEKCYLRDDKECGNYIMCEKGARDHVYRGQVQPCAFGTFWAGLANQQKITCDVPKNVACNNRRCDRNPPLYKYAIEWNCKAYWECGAKGPEPKCCPGDQHNYFNQTLGECTYHKEPCLKTCASKPDACSIPGTLTTPFADGNCRTYWDCEEQRPHPVCCKPGLGYDETINDCTINSPCNNECPREYKPDICLTQDRYALHDKRCRTFMKCNAIEGDERWCCEHGHYFDPIDSVCREKVPGQNYNCTDECPLNYTPECHLVPVANNATQYLEISNMITYTRSCAPGTAFRQDICTCGDRIQSAIDNSCNMELDIVWDFPNMIRSGSQMQTSLEKHGEPQPGAMLNNKQKARFNGDLFYRAPFFQQSMPALFIHNISSECQTDWILMRRRVTRRLIWIQSVCIGNHKDASRVLKVKVVFLPGSTADGSKQVLISNCLALEGGTPSIDLSLQAGRIILSLVASSNTNPNTGNLPVEVSVPYVANEWCQLTAIYDGEIVSMYNMGSLRSFDTKPMTGEIKVAAEGIDLCGCPQKSFMYSGDLHRVQISKCLKPIWQKKFNEATAEFVAPV